MAAVVSDGKIVTDERELCTPETLRITRLCETGHIVRGGPDGNTWVAIFASPIAAEHFVRYCVENQKTFGGVADKENL